MNKVYKLIWSKVRNCWIAVAEIAKSHSKDKKSVIFGTVKGVRVALSATMLVSSLVLPFMAKPVYASAGENYLAGYVSYKDLERYTHAPTNGNYVYNSFTVKINNIAHSVVIGKNLSTGAYVYFQADNAGGGEDIESSWSSMTAAQAQTVFGSAEALDAAKNAVGGGSGGSIDIPGGINGKAITPSSVTASGKVQGATLQSTGNTSVGGALNVTGKTTGSTAEFSGNVKAGSVTVTGNETVGGNETVTGKLTAGSGEITGNFDVDGNLHVKGTSQLDKAVTVGTTGANANLTVHGNETVDGKITAGSIQSNGGVAAGGKVTGVTAGTANSDAVNVKQLNDGLATKANLALDNINDAGKTVVRELAKEAVVVTAGRNVSIVEGENGVAKTYEVVVDGTGRVAEGNTGLINGDTAFKELRPVDGNYVEKNQTTAQNLTKLDTELKNAFDAIGQAGADTEAALATKADRNANNLTDEDVDAWQRKLGDGTIGGNNDTGLVTGNTVKQAITDLNNQMDDALELKADANASNVSQYAQQWANAIGKGSIASDDTRLVTGKTVYEALHNSEGSVVTKEIETKEVNSEKITTNTIEGQKAEFNTVNTEEFNTTNATIEEAHITNIIADKVETNTIETTNGTIDHLESTDVKAETLEATNKVNTKDFEATGITELNRLNVNGFADFKDTATFEKDITVKGNTRMEGDLTVEGDTNLNNTTVNGEFTVNGDEKVNGDQNVTGKSTVGSQEVLGNSVIDGNQEIKGSLKVDGPAEINGKLDAKDDLEVGKNLKVNGDARIVGDTTMEGDAEVQGDFRVEGDTNLKDTMVDGTLKVTGEATFDDKLTAQILEVLGDSTIDGSQNIHENLTVEGQTELKGNVTTGKDLEVGRDLTVNGTSTFKDNVTMEKDLGVQGNTALAGDLSVAGNTDLANVHVSGESQLDGNTKIGTDDAPADLDVTGNTNIGKNLHVVGETQLDGNTTVGSEEAPAEFMVNGNSTVSGNSVVGGNQEIGENLKVVGTSELTGDVTMGSNASVAGDFTVEGNSALNGTLEVAKEATFHDNVAMDKDLAVAGNANIGENLVVEGTSTLKGDVAMEANADVAGDFHVGGNSQLDGNVQIGTEEAPADLNVTGNASVGKDFAVEGNTDLKGDVNVGGDLHADNGTSYFDKSVWHEGEEHQVEINETGIRVGLNSTHMDAHGVYAGGHNWDEANAAMNEDGRIKGIYGNFEKDVEVGGKLTAGEFEAKGNTTIGGDLSVAGNTNIAGDTNVGGNFTVEGDSHLKNTVVDGTLNVTNNSNFGGNVTVQKNITVEGDANFKQNVTMKSATIEQNLNVGGVVNAPVVNTGDVILNGNSLKDTLSDMSGNLNEVRGEVKKVGAGAAALANLHPFENDAGQKWNIAASYGNYRGESAGAMGLFYRPSGNVQMNFSSTIGQSNNMFGGGISVALDKPTNDGKSRAVMQKEIDGLKNAIRLMANEMNNMKAQQLALNGMTKEFPDVPGEHWAHEAVVNLHGSDIVQGYPDGEFKGERPMTRYEYAEMLYNAINAGKNVPPEMIREYRAELEQVKAARR